MAFERGGAGLRGSADEPLRDDGETLALPTLAFDEFLHYTPSWQEVASFGGVLAYGVIVYSLSYRYLPLYARPKGEDSHVPGD